MARQMLVPYVVSGPKRGIIGNSRYAVRLRKDIVAASRDPDRFVESPFTYSLLFPPVSSSL
jgi:hypothetical protein